MVPALVLPPLRLGDRGVFARLQPLVLVRKAGGAHGTILELWIDLYLKMCSGPSSAHLPVNQSSLGTFFQTCTRDVAPGGSVESFTRLCGVWSQFGELGKVFHEAQQVAFAKWFVGFEFLVMLGNVLDCG